jgi:hypothetical protein
MPSLCCESSDSMQRQWNRQGILLAGSEQAHSQSMRHNLLLKACTNHFQCSVQSQPQATTENTHPSRNINPAGVWVCIESVNC